TTRCQASATTTRWRREASSSPCASRYEVIGTSSPTSSSTGLRGRTRARLLGPPDVFINRARPHRFAKRPSAPGGLRGRTRTRLLGPPDPYQRSSKLHEGSPAHWHDDSTTDSGPGSFIQRRQPS